MQKLATFEPGGFPFISLYLNTEPNKNGQFNFDFIVKNQIREHEDDHEPQTAERESFDRDAERINEFLTTIAPSTKGAAIFACAGADDFFETKEFSVPFEEDYFFVFDKPYLFPLVRLIEQNPLYAVVLADTNAAHIYTFKRGNVVKKEDIQNIKTNSSVADDRSHIRYQRQLENFHQQHAKEIVEDLDKIVRKDGIKQIVLAGDEAVIIPILRAELTKELDDKVIDVLRLNVNTPENEVIEASEQAIRQHDTLADKEKIDNLMEQNYDAGLGVTGVEKTLEALSNGQVQELYISADSGNIEYDPKKVFRVLTAYAPGDEEIPNLRKSGSVVDEVIRLALQTADNIRFIEDENLLKDVGGVGALLRYQITADAATNQ